MAALSNKDLFDFRDINDIIAFTKSIESLKNTYVDFLKQAENGNSKLSQSMNALVSSVEKAMQTIRGLDTTNQAHQKQIDKMSASVLQQADQYKKLQESQKAYQSQIKELTESVKTLEKENAKFKKLLDDTNKPIKAQTGSLADLGEELKKARKEQNALNKKLSPEAYEAAEKKVLQLTRAVVDQKKENREAARTYDLAETSLEGMRVALNQARRAFDRLSKEERENEQVGGELIKQINGLDKEIRELELTTGRAQRNVGNYTQSIVEATKRGAAFALGVFGITGALDVLNTVFRFGFDRFVEFDFVMSKVAAVTNATSNQMQALTENARELGAQTQFTAGQVGTLQLNLSKLGFTPEQITASTRAILNLSQATGEDLGESATIAASVLKGFGLEATETANIVDIMAKSFSTSALDLEKFSESIKDAIPFAKNANVDITGLSGALGVLADRGISGTRAGTALKNIFLEMSTEGSKLSKQLGFTVNSTEDFNKALAMLNEQAVGASEATELVGKIAGGSLSILVENADRVNELTESYNNASGAASLAASIMGNSLKGQIDLLNSAAEGLALDLVEDLEPAIRAVVNGLTLMLTAFSDLPEDIESNKVVMSGFVGAIALLNLRMITNTGIFDKNTISRVKNTLATTNGTSATKLLTLANRGLNTVLRSNLWGIAIAGVTALIALYVSWKEETNEAAKAQRTLEGFTSDLNKAVSKEVAETRLLFSALKDTNTSTDVRNRLIAEINSKYKDYLPNLLNEKSTLEDIEKAQQAVIAAQVRRIAFAVKEEEIQKLIRKRSEQISKDTSRQLDLNRELEKSVQLRTNAQARLNAITNQEIEVANPLDEINRLSDTIGKLTNNIVLAQSKLGDVRLNASLRNDAKQFDDDLKAIEQSYLGLLASFGLEPETKIKTNLEAPTSENEENVKQRVRNVIQEINRDDDLSNINITLSFGLQTEQEALNEAQAKANERIEAALKIFKSGQNQELDSLEEFEAEKNLIESESESERTRIQLRFARLRLANLKASGNASVNEISQARQEILDLEAESLDREVDKTIKAEQRKRDAQRKTLDVARELGAKTVELIDTLFEARQADREREFEALEAEEERRLELAGDNEAAKTRIEERFARKREALQKKQQKEQVKQARFQKAVNIASIIGNTASAIISALAPPPVGLGAVAGIPLSVLIGSIGALQLATAISTPIPAFKDGRKGGLNETMAIVNEEGQEIGYNRTTKQVRLLGKTGKGAELEHLNRNEEVWTASETNDFLDTLKVNNISLPEVHQRDYKEIMELQKPVKVSIPDNSAQIARTVAKEIVSKMPIEYTTIEDGEMKTYIKKGMTTIKTNNKRKTLHRGNE